MNRLMREYFETITLSLFNTELNPLACQIGACALIHYAEQKIIPESEFYDEGDVIEPGVDLYFYADCIDDFFIDINGNLIKRKISYIDVKPYSKYKKRIFEAFRELQYKGFIESVIRLDNSSFDFILTEKLKKHQIIPYSIYHRNAVM